MRSKWVYEPKIAVMEQYYSGFSTGLYYQKWYPPPRGRLHRVFSMNCETVNFIAASG
jgi:hypothetical protein